MSVAKSYATALYQTVKDPGTQQAAPAAMDLLESDLKNFVSMVEGSRETQIVLYGPVTSRKEKTDIVQKLGEAMKLQGKLPNFLALLARKGRLALLPEIRDAFQSVRLEQEGGLMGQLVSAEQMSAQDVEGLAQAFGKKLGKRVQFRVSTDPLLLAGMKVTVNGTTYDGTLRSQLQKLREQVAEGQF